MATHNRHLFKWLFVINFAVTLGFGVADTFFSVFVQELGARGLLFGVAISLYAGSKIIFSPFMGSLSDRFGRKIIIVTSLILFTLISLCYLQSTNLYIIIALRMVQGVGCAMFRPVVVSLVGENAPSQRRGTMVATFDISFYAALSLGPLAGGIVMDLWGFNGIFTLLALLSFVALFVALRYIPVDVQKATHTKQRSSSRSLSNEAPLSWQHSSLTGLVIFIFGRACGIITLVAFMPILLTTKLGLSGAQIGMIMASTTLTMTLLLRPMGQLADRVSRPMLVMVGGTMVSLLYLLIPAAHTFTQMLTIGIAIGFFSGVSQPASTALLVEEGERYGTGFAIGSFTASLNLGLAVGPLLGALLFSTIGLNAVFYGASCLGLLAVMMFSITIRSGLYLNAAPLP